MVTTDTPTPSSLVSGEVNNSTLIIGPTGSGKTTLIYTLAKWAWLRYGAITFLYSSDGGGYPDCVAAGIQKGFIKIFRMRSRNGGDDSLALETTMKSSRGWWPARINPRTGMTEPNVPMVPPTIQNTDGTWRTNKGFPERRVVCFDGLSSLSDWWVDDMQARAGRLEITGGERGGGIGVIVSGTERFSGGSRSQVGFSQSRAHQFVMNTNGIPGLALPPIFTALTNEATDEASLRICGPKLAGQKKTDEGPQWVGNVLEARQASDDKGNRIYRLYLTEFVEDGIRHLCKNRAEAGFLPPYLQDPAPEAVVNGMPGQLAYPGAYSEFNLGKFFELMELAHARAIERLNQDERFQQAPGIEEIEYGDQVALAASMAGPRPASAPGAPVPTPPPVRVTATPSPAPTPTARPAAPAPAPAPTGGVRPAPPPTSVTGSPAPTPTMRTVPPPPLGGKAPARAPAVPPAK